MADASISETLERARRRLFWPGGLSARLLVLTILFAAIGGLLTIPAALAAYERQWLLDRVRAAELASAGGGRAALPAGRLHRVRGGRHRAQAGAGQLSLAPGRDRGLRLHPGRRAGLCGAEPLPRAADAADHPGDGAVPRRPGGRR